MYIIKTITLKYMWLQKLFCMAQQKILELQTKSKSEKGSLEWKDKTTYTLK